MVAVEQVVLEAEADVPGDEHHCGVAGENVQQPRQRRKPTCLPMGSGSM